MTDRLTKWKEIFTAHDYRLLKWLFFSILIYFIFFYRLDTMRLLDFDEARVAKSSYEMSESGELIVITYKNWPDLWSTKPPFFNWFQALSIKLLGLSTLSVRLPCAIAGALLCLILYRFCKKQLGNGLLGGLAVLVFISAPAVSWIDHSFRSADYDAFLVLFGFLASLSLFRFLEQENANRQIYLFFLFLTCAVLTKGIAAFFLAPGYLLYVLVRKKLLFVLRSKHFYFGLAGMIILAGSYFVARELKFPGYLRALNNMEIMGRFTHSGGFAQVERTESWFNYFRFIGARYPFFYLLIPSGILTGPFSKDGLVKKFTLFSTFISIGVMAVLSFSSNSNAWYDLPVFPFVAFITAHFFYYLWALLKELSEKLVGFNYRIAGIILCFLLFITPFREILANQIIDPPNMKGDTWRLFTLLADYLENGSVQNGYIPVSVSEPFITHSGYFYIDVLKDKKGISLGYRKDKNYQPQDRLITMDVPTQQFIEAQYNFEVLETYYEIKVYKILGPKVLN